jgi:hypothetical protein
MMSNATDDIAAGLRAWARRAKAAGLSDMREALNAYALEVERVQDQLRKARAALERAKEAGL